MTILCGCFTAIVFTVRVGFVRQYSFVLRRVYNKIVLQFASVSMLEVKTSGRLHQIMVSTISDCVMFFYWGSSNLVLFLQREFRPLCAACWPRECWIKRLFKTCTHGMYGACWFYVVELWVLGTWKMKQRLLQRIELCRCVWEHRLSLKCRFYIGLK